MRIKHSLLKLSLCTIFFAARCSDNQYSDNINNCCARNKIAPADYNKIKTELYLGDNRFDNTVLDDFLRNNVLTKFEGFTIVDGYGGWNKNVFKSKILIIVHSGSISDNQKIESIRGEFKKELGHRSIMRVDTISNINY